MSELLVNCTNSLLCFLVLVATAPPEKVISSLFASLLFFFNIQMCFYSIYVGFQNLNALRCILCIVYFKKIQYSVKKYLLTPC